jgi:hypothetical protein
MRSHNGTIQESETGIVVKQRRQRFYATRQENQIDRNVQFDKNIKYDKKIKRRQDISKGYSHPPHLPQEQEDYIGVRRLVSVQLLESLVEGGCTLFSSLLKAFDGESVHLLSAFYKRLFAVRVYVVQIGLSVTV